MTIDTATTTTQPSELTADAFAERVFASALGGLESLSMYVGDRLGWYRALAAGGPATPAELAARTGTQERYAREWLEQQAVYGILSTEPADPDRRFALPPAAAEVLTDESSLAYLGPLARLLAAAAGQLPQLMRAYRQGGGVSWDQLGDDAREAQADLNRPWFERRLGDALHGVPAVHSVLGRPNARIADVGCGAGSSVDTADRLRADPLSRLTRWWLSWPRSNPARPPDSTHHDTRPHGVDIEAQRTSSTDG